MCAYSGACSGAYSDAYSFAIAGIGMQICCDQPRLLEKLAQRYAGFQQTSPASPQFTLHLNWQRGPSDASRVSPLFTLRGDQLYFDVPHYSGQIDLARAEASLSLISDYPVSDVDYFLRVAYALLLFRAGGILVHGAGIVRAGRGYLFFGHSGSGKTTVARLSPNDLVLNDDLIAIMPGEGNWAAWSTPFWNFSQVRPAPGHAPLTALYRLVQAVDVRRERMLAGQAAAELVASTPVLPADPPSLVQLLGRYTQLLAVVPAYRLYFLPDDSFWPAAATPEEFAGHDL